MPRRTFQTVSVRGTFDENFSFDSGSSPLLFEPVILTAALLIVATFTLIGENTWRYASAGAYLGCQLSLFVHDSPLIYGILLLILAFIGIATDSSFFVCILSFTVWAAVIMHYSKIKLKW